MATKRSALILDPEGRVFRELQGREFQDWEFLRAASMEEIGTLPLEKEIEVGLLVLGNETSAVPEKIDRQLAAADLEWIAVVPPEAVRNPSLCSWLGRAFYDFHTLPLDRLRLLYAIGHSHGRRALTKSYEFGQAQTGRFGLTGRSPQMLELYRQIDKVLSVDAPVLIGGESGSGKELVARAIHAYSARAKKPFMAMNCAALPQSLMLPELFGHEKGAFTGAHKRKIGKIEAAQGGVLFLDEIGDLPLEVQSYLLRFLEEKSIVRIGSTQLLRVDVRVVAATHVDLERAVERERFREDLYYRLNVLQLNVPPLRYRTGDIPLFADAILADHSKQRNLRVRGFSAAALHAMAKHDWPGNVRELINRVQQAIVMSDSRLIRPRDLGLDGEGPRSRTLEEAHAEVDRKLIEDSLAGNGGNLSEVARQLGISRVTLYKMIDRLKIVL
jgi:DNA-binding NtrC family response regulator